MILLEHSYSSFKTQLRWHIHGKPSLRHHYLSSQENLAPSSVSLLPLSLTTETAKVGAVLGEHVLYARHCRVYILCRPFTEGISPFPRVRPLFLTPILPIGKLRARELISSWSHSLNWSLNLDRTPKPSSHSKPAWHPLHHPPCKDYFHAPRPGESFSQQGLRLTDRGVLYCIEPDI